MAIEGDNMNISKLIILSKKEKPTREEFIYMLYNDPEMKKIVDMIKQFTIQKKISEGKLKV